MRKDQFAGDPGNILKPVPAYIPPEYFDESKDERFTCARCEEVFNMDISLVFSFKENKEVYYCGSCKRFALLRYEIHEIQVK